MYSEKELEILLQIQRGFVWRAYSNLAEDEIIRGLMNKGLVRSREDIKENLVVLTAEGHAALEQEHKRKAETDKQERKEQAKEAKRLVERKEDTDNEERRHREQKQVAIWVPLVTTLLGVIAGTVIEHIVGIWNYVQTLGLD